MANKLIEFTLWLAHDSRDLLARTNALHAAGCHTTRCEIDERQLAGY